MEHPIPMPAPSPSGTAITSPIAVVGQQYCIAESPVDLVIKRKTWTLSNGNFTVTHINKNIIFKLEAKWSLHYRRTLLDPDGNPIVTLQPTKMSMHGRWNVFKGESIEEKDLLFTAKLTSWMQLRTNIKMDVFLANNTKQKIPDFRLKGNSFKTRGIIYAGDGESKTILGQCESLGMDLFSVKIYPNVDSAFIVALIAIFLPYIDGSSSDGSELQPLFEALML